MKSIQTLIIRILLLVLPFFAFSQVTDTGGNVGLRATNSNEKLQIEGRLGNWLIKANISH